MTIDLIYCCIYFIAVVRIHLTYDYSLNLLLY